MKVSPGYNPVVCYDLPTLKKLVPGFLICVILPLSLTAQDSLRLRSFGPGNIYYLPLVFADAGKTKNWKPVKKGPYQFTYDIRFNPDTAAINDRYKPGANPRRLWYLTNLPTEEQVKAQAEKARTEESIGRYVANEVFQTIFRRKKIPAVKPTF